MESGIAPKRWGKYLYILIAVVAFLGILDAAYLSWVALLGEAPTCFLNTGCDVVAQSAYSRVFGIPLATFGVFFYALLFGFSAWKIVSPTVPVLRFLLPLSALGFLLSLYFLYLQAFVIHAYCEYCLFSLFDASVAFVTALYLWRRFKKQGSMESIEPPHEDHGTV